MNINITDKIQTILYSWWLGLLWWLASMLYKQSKWEKFNTIQYISSLSLAFIVAWIIWEFIPSDYWFRDWLLWIAWVTSHTLMAFIQSNWYKLILKSTPLWALTPIKSPEEQPKEEDKQEDKQENTEVKSI